MAWMRQARARQRASRWSEPLWRWEAWQSYGEWFESMPWDWFATFTLPGGSSREYLVRALRRWSSRMHTKHGRQLRQVMAIERQRNGTAHAHALVYGDSTARDVCTWAPGRSAPACAPGCSRCAARLHAMSTYEEVGGGFARIYPYRGAGGAAAYCAKYVTKDGDVMLWGPWPRYQRPQPDLWVSR